MAGNPMITALPEPKPVDTATQQNTFLYLHKVWAQIRDEILIRIMDGNKDYP